MPAATAPATTATATRGRSNGNRASGRARRTSGRTANASASRSGPRDERRRHVRREPPLGAGGGADRAVRVRAPPHPTTVGPCTRTPFERAMPPSRSFSIAVRVPCGDGRTARCSTSSPPPARTPPRPGRHRRPRGCGKDDARADDSRSAGRLDRRVLGRRRLRHRAARARGRRAALSQGRTARFASYDWSARSAAGIADGRAARGRRRRGGLRAPPYAPRRVRRARLGRGAVRRAARARGRAGRRGVRAPPGSTCGCRRRIGTSSATTPSAARISWSTTARLHGDGRLAGRGLAQARPLAGAPPGARRRRARARTDGPSTATTGITSRTDEDVNTSSAARSRSSGKTPFDDPPALTGGELEQRCARLAGEDADLERRRQEHVALAPPDVRHRAFEHDAVRVDEHGVVGAARLRLGLGGDADGVARRLRRRKEPRRRPPLVEQRDEPLPTLARRPRSSRGSR